MKDEGRRMNDELVRLRDGVSLPKLITGEVRERKGAEVWIYLG